MRIILADSQHVKSMSENVEMSTIDQHPNSVGNEDYFSISIIISYCRASDSLFT